MALDALGWAEKQLAELEEGKATAEAEAARLSEEIARTDPDDAKSFAKLVAARDAARGRAEALAARIPAAQQALGEASARAAAAARKALEAELAEIERNVRARDAELTAEARKFRDTLTGRIAELTALAGRANALEADLDQRRGVSRPWRRSSVRGSEWLTGRLDDADPLATASRILGS